MTNCELNFIEKDYRDSFNEKGYGDVHILFYMAVAVVNRCNVATCHVRTLHPKLDNSRRKVSPIIIIHYTFLFLTKGCINVNHTCFYSCHPF